MTTENNTLEIQEELTSCDGRKLWIPKDLDPKMAEMMEISNRFFFKPLCKDSPELSYFNSLDKKQLKEWDDMVDRAIDFYLTFKETAVFVKGAMTFDLYMKYKESIREENDALKILGKRTLKIPFDLKIKKVLRGIYAAWERVWWDDHHKKTDGRARRSEYIRQTQSGLYGRDVFRLASKSIKNHIYEEFETTLGPLRQQTRQLTVVRRELKKLGRMNETFYQKPGE